MGQNFWTDLFTVCFTFGAAVTILSSLLGFSGHTAIHIPHIGHVPVHFGHLGHGHVGGAGHTAASGGEISPLNVSSILAFLVIFGAIGLIAQNGLGAFVAFVLAALGGLVAAWVAYIFIARFLIKGQTFLVDEPIVGTIGTVSAAIGPGRVGEIIYTRHGVRRSDGARSHDGKAIKNGEEVVILSVTNGIATVQPWREFLEGTPRAPDRLPGRPDRTLP